MTFHLINVRILRFVINLFNQFCGRVKLRVTRSLSSFSFMGVECKSNVFDNGLISLFVDCKEIRNYTYNQRQESKQRSVN